jgi:hypothetical protein
MPRSRTRLLMLAATFLSGILAGSAVDRALVSGPAWHELGAAAWLEYSRRADLVVYPIEGIGTTLLTLAAVASNHLDGNRRRETVLPLCCAAAFSIVGLLLTIKAAPIMLSLAVPQSAAAAQRAFDEFFVWGLYLRGAADTLAFAALVWALSNLHRDRINRTLGRFANTSEEG